MVQQPWVINQQIFHTMFYDGGDEAVVNLFEYDEYSIKRNIIRYFQHDHVELSYPSKQFCVRYIYASVIEHWFENPTKCGFFDSNILYNNSGAWYDDHWNIFEFLVQHIGNPLMYRVEGVLATIEHAEHELLLMGV